MKTSPKGRKLQRVRYVHHDTDTMRAELDRATTHRTQPAAAV